MARPAGRMTGVLLVGPYPPPYGGPNVHMVYLRRSLEAAGVSCPVLNIGARRREHVADALPVRSGPHFVRQVARWVRRGHRVHHFFNAESPKAVALAAAAALVTRGLGGSYSIGFIGGPRQRYLDDTRSIAGRLLRVPMRLADFVVCNNPSVRERLTPFCSDARKIHTIESFHPAQAERVGNVPTASEAFLRGRRPVLCCVVHPRRETAAPHHEMTMLVEALSAIRVPHPEVGCVVVGGADCVPLYRTMVATAALEAHVWFAGEVPHSECLALMRRADVFVRAYEKDGSSSSVREALALGVPTVASRNPQHPAAVMPFEPGSGASLAGVVLRALTRGPELRQALERCAPVAGGEIERELALLGVPRANGSRHGA